MIFIFNLGIIFISVCIIFDIHLDALIGFSDIMRQPGTGDGLAGR